MTQSIDIGFRRRGQPIVCGKDIAKIKPTTTILGLVDKGGCRPGPVNLGPDTRQPPSDHLLMTPALDRRFEVDTKRQFAQRDGLLWYSVGKTIHIGLLTVRHMRVLKTWEQVDPIQLIVAFQRDLTKQTLGAEVIREGAKRVHTVVAFTVQQAPFEEERLIAKLGHDIGASQPTITFGIASIANHIQIGMIELQHTANKQTVVQRNMATKRRQSIAGPAVIAHLGVGRVKRNPERRTTAGRQA